MPTVRFGCDILVHGNCAIEKSARIGLVTNDAARLAANAQITSRAALREAGFNLTRLFSPEHGIAAAAPDGAAVADSVDAVTGLPVISLYGQTHRPDAEHLGDLDVVMFDIPDVGARFYTYIWTLSHVLEACAEVNKPLIVLDRPNPIGGALSDCEGPMLDEMRFSTFVGRWNISIRHGLTVGELATLWNHERQIGADLNVVKCQNWRRDMHWPDTGLPFVPTSPAMPDYQSALAYPGSCLFEGTNLHEGRGTDSPFRTIGAPWINAHALSDAMADLDLAGLLAPCVRFQSRSRNYAGQWCNGVRLTITEPRIFRPVATALHLLAIIMQLHPDQFSFSPYPTAANQGAGAHFDRLVGTDEVRTSLASDPHDPSERIARWTQTGDWTRRAEPHLLYE